MRKFILFSIILFTFSIQLIFAGLSKQIVYYKIQAKLVPGEKAVVGREELTWLNNSDKFISELQFHLYLNAFKNNRSTFMKESRGFHRRYKLDPEHWGYIEIKSIKILNGSDLTSTIEYIQPDDNNKDDQTVMKVSLPKPIPPQEKITLDIEFYSKLPKVFARSGFKDNFYMVGQWFPKIGVLWRGEWNCHQYHLNSEFFADYGVYEVDITVPEEYVVGATGKRVKEIAHNDGTKTYTYYQEDVHDFAWTACPDFKVFREKFILKDLPVNTEIILLLHKQHLNQKKRYLKAIKQAIEFYSINYGPYPYQTITIVDPAPAAWGAGGMEYPTLITGGSISWLPKGLLMVEMVVIHEFGHNYWYGIVGSNEFEEAWLDEGINTYSEIKAMTEYYGSESSMIKLWGIKISDLILQRLQVIASGKMDPILKKSWEFYSRGSYSINSYSKAALMLLTLENYLGEDVMSKIMRAYFEKWRFKHPTTEDFIATTQEVSGQDLTWFFNQFMYSPDKLDYAIGEVKCELIKEQKGIFDKKPGAGSKKLEAGGKKLEAKDRKQEAGSREQEKIYKNEVVVIRKGELIFPQEILVEFEDGEKIIEKWDGKERWKRFIYFKPKKIKCAQLDPEGKIVIDVNFINNSRTLRGNKTSPLKYALSVMFNFQNILASISF
ncbi:MAG: M1 family metallopeptidase [Candidatus Aminicenantia bacterium]